MRLKRQMLGVAVFVLGATGCGSGVTAQGPTTNVPVVDGSRQHIYSSLKALATDSPSIVIATAAKQEATAIHGVPFTITTMRLTKEIKGTAPSTFRVQQLGTGAEAGGDAPAVATVGQAYLPFLQQYEQQPGVAVADDLFVTVGADAGMYARHSDKFDKVDSLSPDPPSTLTEGEARQAASP
jgi:hypothetical protein